MDNETPHSYECTACKGTGKVNGKRCSCWGWFEASGPDECDRCDFDKHGRCLVCGADKWADGIDVEDPRG
jgi:hypothetical protein